MPSSLTVYKASAGSGKTFTLTIEYIKTIITQPSPNAFSHILAVTFTNKATAEMKNRILQQLYGIWKALPSSNNYLNALKAQLKADNTPLNNTQIQQRAGAALRSILHNYDHFRIETIDSFFQSILRNLAHELNLTPNLKVELNDKQALSKAVDNLTEHLDEKPEVLKWVLAYAKERIANNQHWDISRELKTFGQCIFKEDYLLHEQALRNALNNNQLIETLKNELYKIIKNTKENVVTAARNLTQQMIRLNISYNTLSHGKYLNSYVEKLKTGQLNTKFPTTLQSWLDNPEKMLRTKDRQNSNLLSKVDILRDELQILRQAQQNNLIPHTSASVAAKHLNPLRLLGEIDEQVIALNQEYNRFLLAKTPILLHQLIQQSDAPFIFEKTGVLFQHAMIDEFQDTSLLQWNILKNLLLENIATGHSNLVVGDIKQSIYRWRNGDWTILNNIAHEMAQHNPDIRTLNTNFRSDKCIIKFNNALFPNVATLLDSLDLTSKLKIKDAYEDVIQKCPDNKPDGGYVRMKWYKDEEGYETAVLNDLCAQVERLHDGGLPYNEMTILLRKRRHIAPIIRHFATHLPKVKLVSDEAFALSASKSINLMIAAMRYMANPCDLISLHYLLLYAPCSSIKISEEKGENNNTLLEISPIFPQKTKTLTKEHGNYYAEMMLKNIDKLKALPLYELQETLYMLLNLNLVLNEDAFVFAYFDCVAEYLKDNAPDINSFLTYWDETLSKKAIPSGETDGIRILTIHKSKGLQFHTVMAPFCDWDIEKDPRGPNSANDLLWCPNDDYPYNILEVIPITPQANLRDTIFCDYYERERLMRRVDAVNLLYVCFTRAEHNLFAWWKTNGELDANSGIGDLLNNAMTKVMSNMETTGINDNCNEWEYGTTVTLHDSETLPADANRLSPNLTPLRVKMNSQDTQIDFQQSGKTKDFMESLTKETDRQCDTDKRQMGILLHRIFSTIYTKADVEKAIAGLENEGLLAGYKEREELLRQIETAFGNAQVDEWFDGTADIYNECPIITQDFDKSFGSYLTLRPDRVMLTPGKTTVVDFKFGSPNPQHNKQVEAYMELLKQMEPEREIEGYLWYILDGNRIVKVETQK